MALNLSPRAQVCKGCLECVAMSGKRYTRFLGIDGSIFEFLGCNGLALVHIPHQRRPTEKAITKVYVSVGF